jgi:Txe/YoeB family toxin of Txe-Axe toxin-antitoxin module
MAEAAAAAPVAAVSTAPVIAGEGVDPVIGARAASTLKVVPKTSSKQKIRIDHMEADADDSPLDPELVKQFKANDKKRAIESDDDDEPAIINDDGDDSEFANKSAVIPPKKTTEKGKKEDITDIDNLEGVEDDESGSESDEDDPIDTETIHDSSELDDDTLNQKLKVKVDGEEKTYTLKQVLEMVAKNESGDKKLYQAAELTKKVENIVSRMKQEPFEVLADMAKLANKDYTQMIQDEHARLLQLNMMSEDQRKVYLQNLQDQKDLRRYRETEAERVNREKAEAEQKQQSEATTKFVGEIGDEIEKDPYLAKVYQAHPDNKNYIVQKYFEFVKEGLKMQSEGKLDKNFALVPNNLTKLVIDEIKREAAEDLKKATRASTILNDNANADNLQSGSKTVKKPVPGVGSKKPLAPNKKPVPKQTKQDRKKNKIYIEDFMDELLYS